MKKEILLPDFIIIPRQVQFCDELQSLDKCVYGIIYWLERLKEGKCIASNKYLSEICKSTPNSIQHSLERLEKQGFILRIYLDEGKKRRKEIKSLITYGVLSIDNRVLSASNTGVLSIDNHISNSPIKSNSNINNTRDLVSFFFELRGWVYNKDKHQGLFKRHLKPSKELLDLCDNDLDEAKNCITKIKEWAESRNLDWSIETVFKRWYDLDFLKPKEKKPHFDGCRIFQKTKEGKWYIIRHGEIKELGLWPRKEEIIWK